MNKTTINFGVIKDAISKKSAFEYIKEGHTRSMDDFVESINKTPLLKKQYLIFKNFEKTKPFKKERLAERFILQNMKLLEGVKWNDIINENRKLRTSLLGNPDDSHVFSKKENEELFENLSIVIEASTNSAFNDMEKEAEAYDFLVSHLTRELSEDDMNEEEERPKFNKFWKFIAEGAMNNFKKRYSALNESEKEIFKTLISDSPEKRASIISLRESLIEEIKEKVGSDRYSDDEKELMKEFKEKLEKEIPNEQLTSNDYIISCYELKNALREIL